MKALGYHPTEAEVQDLISIVDDKGILYSLSHTVLALRLFSRGWGDLLKDPRVRGFSIYRGNFISLI